MSTIDTTKTHKLINKLSAGNSDFADLSLLLHEWVDKVKVVNERRLASSSLKVDSKQFTSAFQNFTRKCLVEIDKSLKLVKEQRSDEYLGQIVLVDFGKNYGEHFCKVKDALRMLDSKNILFKQLKNYLDGVTTYLWPNYIWWMENEGKFRILRFPKGHWPSFYPQLIVLPLLHIDGGPILVKSNRHFLVVSDKVVLADFDDVVGKFIQFSLQK
jgi:hypothetical protein